MVDQEGFPHIRFCYGCNHYKLYFDYNKAEFKELAKDHIFICQTSTPFIHGRGQCPCSLCLVKAVCIKKCETFERYNSKEVNNEMYKSMF